MSLPIAFRRSPNFGRRPQGGRVDCIVLHADAGRTEAGTIGWACDPASKVSYHYLVHRDGQITQLVPGEMRAWHAGASSFQGRPNVNDFSLGVAFGNRQDGEPFKVAQLQRGVELVADLCWEYRIPLTRITTHAAIAPGRKSDPGPLFPLAQFCTDVGAELARRRTEGLE
jgi:N-acetylmuramoyl-L-alanine amidase